MSTKQIRVSEVPADRVKFIRALRLVGNMALKQANDLAIHLHRFRNCVVVAGIGDEAAQHIATELRAAGADVVVEECSIDTPMLCCPPAAVRFVWSRFQLIKKAI
jgi:ribosomal protein L7/L12